MVRRTSDPVRWVVFLLAADVLLQRFSLPGISIPITVPLAVLWVGLGLLTGVLVLHPGRLTLWLAAAGTSALVVVPQLVVVAAPFVSVNSWAYWIVTWFPVVVGFRNQAPHAYRRSLRAVGHLGVLIGAVSALFGLLQLLGIGYRDWLAEFVPSALLVQGYATSYPVVYGSEVYKSNAWFALEPSFLSFTLGAFAMCAILVRLHPLTVLVMGAGLLATAAGSGLAILAVGVIALVWSRAGRSRLRPYLLPGMALAIVSLMTPFGPSVLTRLGDEGRSGSSASLRSIEPYLYLLPQWTNDPAAVLFGRGAGSSRWVTDNLGIPGLLVPSVAKVLFDYGLLAGALLLLLILAVFRHSPEPALALALAVSMLTVQPASQPLVLCAIALCSLWSSGGRDTRPASPVPIPAGTRQLLHGAGGG